MASELVPEIQRRLKYSNLAPDERALLERHLAELSELIEAHRDRQEQPPKTAAIEMEGPILEMESLTTAKRLERLDTILEGLDREESLDQDVRMIVGHMRMQTSTQISSLDSEDPAGHRKFRLVTGALPRPTEKVLDQLLPKGGFEAVKNSARWQPRDVLNSLHKADILPTRIPGLHLTVIEELFIPNRRSFDTKESLASVYASTYRNYQANGYPVKYDVIAFV